MDLSEQYAQYEQALRDPATRGDPDKLVRTITGVYALLEALHSEIAALDKERESLLVAHDRLRHELGCTSVSGSGKDTPTPAPPDESLLGLFLDFHADPCEGDASIATEIVAGPSELHSGIEGLKPITRLLTEVALQCQALSQLPLSDELFVAELERTLELDLKVRQRILSRAEGAL